MTRATMSETALDADTLVNALEKLLGGFDLPDRLGVAAMLSKRLLRRLPVALQAETAAAFAYTVQQLRDA